VKRRIAVAAAALVFPGALLAPTWAASPHQRKPVALTSTLRTEYRIMQGKKQMGTEKVEKKVFDNNTVVFTIDATMAYGPGVTMTQHAELTLEEESYFPRTLHILKTVAQPNNDSFQHQIDIEMFSNVAVVTSSLREQKGSRRIVVPTGIAIEDLGVLAYLYQTLFWYDKDTGGDQRFQWFDPISVDVHSGEMKMDREPATITVMKKKTKVSVFRLEREKLGPAMLWVDKQGTIVRGEQNLFTFELVSEKTR
jgi:hypothetical protein